MKNSFYKKNLDNLKIFYCIFSFFCTNLIVFKMLLNYYIKYLMSSINKLQQVLSLSKEKIKEYRKCFQKDKRFEISIKKILKKKKNNTV